MEENKNFTKNLFISFFIVFVFLIFWQMYVGKNMKNNKPTKVAHNTKVDSTNKNTLKDMKNMAPTLSDRNSKMGMLDTLWNAQLLKLNGKNIEVNIAKSGTFYDLYLKRYKTHLLDTTFARYFFTGYKSYLFKDSALSLNLGSKVILYSTDSLEIKTFTFKEDSYLVDFSLRRMDTLPLFVEFDGGLFLNPSNIKEEKRTYSFVVKTKKGYKKYKISSLLKNPQDKKLPLDDVKFIGLKNKYFMFVVINNRNEKGTVRFGIRSHRPYFRIESKDGKIDLLAYDGPIEYFLLKKIGYGLFANYEFGGALIAPFSMAMLYILKFLHNFIPNWGWAIVVFALLMKIVFFPLTYKGLASMRKMQRLKPEIDKLQKIYKNDPQRLQKEMMELYKKHNVNPFSGCLTLLIQLPIFWALYRVLRMTIDLRNSGFIFWIKDLSVKDPYYILPILMGITSIIQSKLQQQGVQDNQTKLFTYFMPIFLVIIFIPLPSGIVLYWFAYNLFSVFETLLIKRLEVS